MIFEPTIRIPKNPLRFGTAIIIGDTVPGANECIFCGDCTDEGERVDDHWYCAQCVKEGNALTDQQWLEVAFETDYPQFHAQLQWMRECIQRALICLNVQGSKDCARWELEQAIKGENRHDSHTMDANGC